MRMSVRHISIDKGFRGKGSGTYFLLFLEDKCKELQKKKIYAEVPKTHKDMLRFFYKKWI